MALKQICYKVLVPSGAPYSYGNFEFNTNLLTEGHKATKVSIEAPPGTLVKINNQEIMIGQSGLWEFNNSDIVVSSIIFPRPIRYSRSAVDPEKKAALQTILTNIKSKIAALNAMTLNTDTAYQNFCIEGEKIFLGNATGYDYDYDGTVLHGFEDVLFKYLSVMQGDLIETPGDLQNVIINYAYSD